MTGQAFMTRQFGSSSKIYVEFAFGADLTADSDTWTWTDVTADVLNSARLSITHGRADDTSQAQPASCAFTLINADGDYTPYNPAGSHYPYVRRSAPVRVRVDLGSGASVLFFGYATGYTPTWDASAGLALTQVSASGALRRLSRGSSPLRSPMHRAILADAPVFYWPMEDDSGAVSCASAVNGVPALTAGTTAPTFGADGSAGSSGAVDFSGGGSLGVVRLPGSPSAGWVVEFSMKLPDSDPSSTDYRAPLTWRTTKAAWVVAVIDDGTDVRLKLLTVDPDDTSTVSVAATSAALDTLYDGEWHNYVVAVTQSESVGTQADATLYQDGVALNVLSSASYSLVGKIVDIGLQQQIPSSSTVLGTLPDAVMAHVAVYADGATIDHSDALDGHSGETADDRITRVCGEEGVEISVTGTSNIAMGPQPVDTFAAILRECEAADGGVLYDGFTAGIGYLCRSARYNQTAAVTVDATATPAQLAPPFAPVDDDQRNRNDVIASRSSGSSGRHVDKDGPLGTDAIGVYDASLTVNVDDDDRLVDIAAWQVHLGTVEALRHPVLALDFTAAPTLAQDWLDAGDVGFRVDVANVTDVVDQAPPDDVRLLVEGHTMTLDTVSWQVVATCSPEAPWEVAVYDTDRYDGGSSSLSSAVDGDDASLSVDVDSGPLWTTSADDMPFDVFVGGERITVAAVSGSSSPQTFTVTRSVNGVTKSHDAGAKVYLWQPPYYAL